jgi:hypothetical protein
VTRRSEPEALEAREERSTEADTNTAGVAGAAVGTVRDRPSLSRAAVMRLQASSGNAAVTALVEGRRTLQRVALSSFNDAKPEHDPSQLTDAQIQSTDEYKAYMAMNPVPIPQRDVLPAEAKLACQLILRQMRQSPVPVATDRSALEQWLATARARGAVTSKAEATIGDQDWVAASPQDVNDPKNADSEFTKWMLGGGTKPDAKTGKLNCWEMVLFSAFREGYLSEAQMRTMYTTAKKQMKDSGDVMEFPRTLERLMRSSNEQIYDPKSPTSPRPLRGDMVIFKEAASHVALATGTRTGAGVEVVSHWPPPDGDHHVKRTTIEALLTPLKLPTAKFWSPVW